MISIAAIPASLIGSTMDELLGVLRPLHEEAFGPDEQQFSMEYMLQRAQAGHYQLRVIRVEEAIAGYACLELRSATRIAFLWYMAISANYRNRGLGRRLVTDTLDTLRRTSPDLKYVFLETHKPLPGTDAATIALDKRRFAFYRRLGAFAVEGIEYRIPAADDGEIALAYTPMFFLLRGVPEFGEVRAGVLLMAQDNFADAPEDPRWSGLQASLSRLVITEPEQAASD